MTPPRQPAPESPNLAFVPLAAQVIATCRQIAACTEEPGRTTRRFLTPPVAEVHAILRARMQSLGMTIQLDAAGNLRGLNRPADAPPPRLIIGSHIDTVPDAGSFDGILGVVTGLALVELARAENLPLAIEVIAFSEEEGVRFSTPFLGSRALVGDFPPSLLALTDAAGTTLDQAIRSFGLDPADLPAAAINMDADPVLGFFEIHIEQGPVLEAESLPLAVVDGIVGQTRLSLTFTGHANHAGTTPMHLRRDGLAAAAEWMVVVESLARATGGLVATVGKIAVMPNAVNVIPASATLGLDLRHMDDTVRQFAVASVFAHAQAIADRRNLTLTSSETMNVASVAMDPGLSAQLASAIAEAGYPLRHLPSGAGHDAMIIAAHIPSAMLFLRSPGGISHHPAETVLPEDVAAALHTGIVFLRSLNQDKFNKPF